MVAPVAPAARVHPVPAIAPMPSTPRTHVTPMVAPVAPVPPTPVTPMVAPPAPPAWNNYQPTTATPPPLKTSDRAVIQSAARVTSGYGQRIDPFTQQQGFHDGIDIAAPSGVDVHSPMAGRVVFAGLNKERGYSVEVLSANGQHLTFSHLGSISAKAGVTVTAGDVIGTVGSSGQSTGPHVHLGVTADGETQDPQKVEGLALFAE
jgi:murein DD-endopeptidase MepM/ murein hydrolase activator NlpD